MRAMSGWNYSVEAKEAAWCFCRHRAHRIGRGHRCSGGRGVVGRSTDVSADLLGSVGL